MKRALLKKLDGNAIFEIINSTIMLIIMFTTLYPFWYCIILSFNDGIDTLRGPLYFWPRLFTTTNYVFILNSSRIQIAFMNSVLRTVFGTLLHLLFTGIVAYGLSKKHLVGRRAAMLFFIFTMYFSGGLIPVYLLIKGLGLIDKFIVYIIPGMWSVYNAILFMSYYESIPVSLEESAVIDGASKFQIFGKIIIPTSLPIFATVAVFVGVSQWNSWFDTVIYTSSDRLITLQSIMSKMIEEAEALQELNKEMASSGSVTQIETIKPITVRAATLVVTTFPIAVVYPFLQKYFVKGIMIGSIKE
jgi:putative aldouronate transport system permease protein